MAIKITDLTAQDNAKPLDWLLMVDRDDQDMSEWGTNKKIAVYHMAQSMFDMTPPTYFLNKKLVGYEPGIDGEINSNDTILTAISKTRTLVDSKAPINSPQFFGNVRLPSSTSIGDVDANEIGYLDGVTSSIQNQLNSKSTVNNPTFTGTITLPTGTSNFVPLKFVSGMLKNSNSLVAGAVEYDGTKVYVTSGTEPLLVRNAVATEQYVDQKISNLVGGAPGALDTLNELAQALNNSANFATSITNLINSKVSAESPTLRGTVTLPYSTSIGPVDSSEIGYLSGVTSSIQDQLNDKSPSDSPEFIGTVVLPTDTTIGLVSAAEISYLSGLTGSLQSQLDDKASNANLDLKADINSPAFSGTVSLPIGTSNSTPLKFSSGTLSINPIKGALEYDGTNLFITNDVGSGVRRTLATLESPVFTGTVTADSFSGAFSGELDENVSIKNFTGDLAGDVTGKQGTTSISATTVTSKVLTGLSTSYSSAQTIAATDSILTAFGKTIYNNSLKANSNTPTFTGPTSGNAFIKIQQNAASATVEKVGYLYFSNENNSNKSHISSAISTDGSASLIFAVSASGSARNSDTSNEVARFTPNGRFLIATSSDTSSHKLVVNGSVKSSSLVLSGTQDTTLQAGSLTSAVTITMPSTTGTLVVSSDDRINNLYSVEEVTATTRSIGVADNNKYIRCTAASGTALTLNGSDAWKVGMIVVIRRATSAGALTLTATNATINDNSIGDIIAGDTFLLKCIDVSTSNNKKFDFI